MERHIFHLSIPVSELAVAKKFYVEALGATVGRENADWLDILLWGHQITLQHRCGCEGHRRVARREGVLRSVRTCPAHAHLDGRGHRLGKDLRLNQVRTDCCDLGLPYDLTDGVGAECRGKLASRAANSLTNTEERAEPR